MTVEDPAPFLRLFLALAIPPEVRKEIGRAQSQLQRCSPPGLLRWTRPDQFHVTVKFLGDVPCGDLGALEKSAATVCAGFAAMELAAQGVGFFPDARKPRVIWVGAEDAGGRLARLHGQMEDALRRFAPVEPREKFTGHITLGRFKPGRSGSTKSLLEKCAALRDRHFGSWQAQELEIVRSELTAQGAVHRTLCQFRLG